MFSLAAGFYDWYFQKPEIRILMLGLDGSGKSTLLERIKAIFRKDKDPEKSKEADKEVLLNMTKITSTVGLNIGRLEIQQANVIIWDLGGAASLRGIWEKYYADAHAIIWMVDSTDPSRFEESKEVLARVTDEPELEGVPLLIFANKCEMPAAISADQVRNSVLCEERGIQKRRQVRAVGVSGIEGKGVQDSILWLVDTLKRSRKADSE